MISNPIYEIVRVPIGDISPNPFNPRKISEEKFQRLVKSIKDSPWMIKLRPIVTNKDGVIIGGNQRYKACLEAGMDHVWIICADKITDEQQRRFILRDNIDFGRYDLEILRQQYTQQELLDYGTEIQLLEIGKETLSQDIPQLPPLSDDEAVEPNIPEEEVEEAKKSFNDNTIKQIVFQLPNDLYEKCLHDMNEISKKLDCDDNTEVFLALINFYEVSNGLEDSDNDSE